MPRLIKFIAFFIFFTGAILTPAYASYFPTGTAASNVGIGTSQPVYGKLVVVNGNVGIGSISPTQVLDVVGTVKATAFSGNGSALTNLSTGWTLGASNVGISTTNNVGIGTASTQTALAVNGNVGIGTWTASSGKLIVRGGNVGIDTSLPASALDVSRSDALSTNEITMYNSNNNWEAEALINAQVYTDRSGSIKFGILGNQLNNSGMFVVKTGTTGSETTKFFVNGAGNVGIGTIMFAASANLHIQRSLNADAFRVDDQDGTDATPFIIKSDGNTGIGISATANELATAKLNVGGIIRSVDTANDVYGEIYTNSTNEARIDAEASAWKDVFMTFYTQKTTGGNAHTEKMRITEFGNVGIGSTAPGAALDVNGTVRATAFSGDGSALTNLSTGWTLGASNVGISTTNNVGIGTNLTTTAGLAVMSGNVGIGTWVPTARLHVSTGTVTNSTGATIPGGFVVTSGGNVGIFTLLPQSGVSLDIVESSSGSAFIGSSPLGVMIRSGANGTGASYMGLDFNAYFGAATNPNGRIGVKGTGSGSFMSFGTSNSYGSGVTNQAMTIDYNGNVGIGTDMVSNTARFTVVGGNIGFGTYTPQTAFAVTNGNVGIGTWTADGGRLIVQGGNLGIGSAVPGKLLDVYGDMQLSNSGKYYGDGSALTNLSTGWTLGAGNVGISTTNNVGIGSANPGQVLDVAGNERIRGTNTLFVGDDNKAGISASATTTPDLQFKTGSATTRMTISSAGNVGIGSINPGTLLDLYNGAIRLSNQNRIYFSNDAFNAYISGTANTSSGVQIVTGGTAQLTIDSAGNVGIDQTSPQYALDAGGYIHFTGRLLARTTVATPTISIGPLGSSATHYVETFNGYDSAGYPRLIMNNNGSNYLAIGDATSGAMAFGTADGPSDTAAWQAQLMYLTQAGNLGIGSATPGTKLDVNGDMRITGGSRNLYFGTDNTSSIETDTATLGSIYLDTGASNSRRMKIDSSGNVGINSTSPGKIFDVAGDIRSSTGNIYVSNNHGMEGFTTGGTQLDLQYIDTSNNLIIGSPNSGYSSTQFDMGSSTPKMVILSGGNVGIGSVNPAKLLDVNGNGRFMGAYDPTVNSGHQLVISESDRNYGARIAYDEAGSSTMVLDSSYGSNDSAALMSFRFSNVPRMTIIGTGNVGIGTTIPSNILHIVSAGDPLKIQSTSSSFSIFTSSKQDGTNIIDMNNISGDLRLRTSSTDRLSITTAGNVGIGSTNPGVKLDVNGTIRSTSGGITFPDNTTQTTAASAGTNYWVTGNVGINTTNNVGLGTVNPGQVLDVNGNIRTGAGSVGSPSLVTTADNTTGLWWPATNVLAVSTNALERMRIDSVGNVGIGTITPLALLQVGVDSSPGRIYSNGRAQFTAVRSNALNTNDDGKTIIQNQSTITQIYDGSGVVAITIPSSGNVGVGTTFPQAGLVVTNGNVGIGTWTAANLLTVGGAGTVGSGAGYRTTAAPTDGMYIQGNVGIGTFAAISGSLVVATGNVGVGTTFPQAGLVVTNGNVGIGTWTAANLLTVGGAGTVGSGAGYRTTAAPTDGMYIQGNVGIGTFAALTGALIVRGGNVGIGTTTAQTAFTVTNGNVGIGTWTSNNYRLTVRPPANAGVGIGTWTPGVGGLIVNTTNAGNVGIGTHLPGTALDVNGDVRVDTGFKYYGDGSALTGVVASASPGGTAGQIQYNNNGATAGVPTSGADGNGNIGIGTVGPGASLEIQKASTYPYLWVSNAAGGNGNVMSIDSSGNVGLGQASPAQKLDIASGYINLSDTYGIMDNSTIVLKVTSTYLDDNATGGYYLKVGSVGSAGAPTYASSSDQTTGMFIPGASVLGIATGGVERARFDASGNMGINNTSPLATLDVARNASNPLFMISTSSGAGGDLLKIDSSGNVGIGVSPASGLDLGKSFAMYRTAVSADATSAAQTIIGVTDTSAARTITLATADMVAGRVMIIKDESGAAGTNNITVATEGAEKIDGQDTITILSDYGVLRVYSNGANWFTF